MKIVSFGELLLRLASPGYTRLFQTDRLETSFCGGEANVAVSLSLFGLKSSFVTKLPNNDIGIAAMNALRYFGVDTSNIAFGNGRMGLYYLERGASQRPSKVIYDREYSAISLAMRSEFDWNAIFNNVDWFHWTGINPALSDELALICEEACKAAKLKGITVSCDLNYRGKLWEPKKAQQIMKPLMQYVDVCICNEEDAEKTLGIKATKTDIGNSIIDRDDYRKTAETIHKLYGCKYIATTLRKSHSASRNGWSSMLFDAESLNSYFSSEYDIQIVDRVGSGDSFAAGIIYSLMNNLDPQDAIEFATAASCLKHTIEGDFNRTTVDDVYALLRSGGHGRVQR